MNERIKELWWKARIGYNNQSCDPEVLEKFAELIIQQCVNNLEIHSTCFDGDVGRGIRTAARLTKEHFGIEDVR